MRSHPPHRPAPASSSHRWRRTAGLAAAVLVVSLGPLAAREDPAGSDRVRLAAAQVAAAGSARAARTYRGQRIRIVQANLRIGLPVRQFQSDVAKVIRQRPDVVTYNEVAGRHASVLAPRAYRLWRTPGKYAGETAVAWNTRSWALVARGTHKVTHVTRKTRQQKVRLGVRYANWVTLRSRRDGRVVSVVAAHTAPLTSVTRGLTPISIRRIASLADRLGRRGPVFVGGDFNMGYRSREYPARLLARERLVPTYDAVGTALPTGDHHGATVDYLFTRGIARFSVGRQRTMHLNSDHDALMADFTPLPRWAGTRGVPFRSGAVLSDPTGSRLDQRVLLDTVTSAIDNAPRGAVLRLATRHLSQRGIVQALLDARRRGVRVQVLTGGRRRTAGERRLAHRLGDRVVGRAWAVRRDGVLHGRPATRMVLSRAGTTDRVSLTLPVALGPALTRGSHRATVVDETRRAYRGLSSLFFRMVRRS